MKPYQMLWLHGMIFYFLARDLDRERCGERNADNARFLLYAICFVVAFALIGTSFSMMLFDLLCA